MSKHDSWGKPNLTERFIYRTKLGRWYASCGRDEDDVLRIVITIASIVLGLAIVFMIKVTR